ncbi:MAG TPA: hypothetical protein VIO33_10325 [Burkholderiaceae bacterium]
MMLSVRSEKKAAGARIAATVGCALAALAAVPASHAQSTTATATATTTTASVAAQRVVIDPTTRRPRAPEFDELATAPSAAAAPQATLRGAAKPDLTGISAHPALKRMQATPTQAQLGAVGQRFKPGMLAFSVAKRDADGSISTQCVTGPDAVATAFSAPAAQGERHDH